MHVYSLNFLCLLFSTTKCMSTDGKLRVFDDGWWGITQKDSVTHRDVLHIMLGRARFHSYQNTYRSNPHLEDVFQEFQMIILNRWAYLQDLVNGKHWRFSHPYGPPPSLLLYLQKQSSMLPYRYCSLLPLKRQPWKLAKRLSNVAAHFYEFTFKDNQENFREGE